MAESSRIRAGVQSFYTPVVVVSGSTEAEKLVSKNGLQLVDIFRPYGTFSDLKLTISTVENTIPLRRFRLCFRTLAGLAPASPEVSDACLAATLSSTPEQEHSEVTRILTHRSEVTQRFQDTRDATPWYQQYQRSFAEQLRLSSHECFDQPVACILVLPSTAPDPINQFVAQFEAVKQSSLYQEGFMDTNIFKYHILLHDPHGEAPPRDPAATYKEMQQAFGLSHCRLLEINSVPPAQAQARVDIWTGLRPLDKSDKAERASNANGDKKVHRESLSALDPPTLQAASAQAVSPNEDSGAQPSSTSTSTAEPGASGSTGGIGIGCCLSDANLASIQEATRDLALKGIIPHLERRVRALHQQITQQRKGVMKQLKLWWKKPRNSGGGEGSRSRESFDGSVLYEYGSMESQLRQLADYAFFLQDYELALAHYRMVASDYKNDKAVKHHAGALEMIGVCLYLTDGSKRECEASLDSAYFNYLRAGGAGRYATRLTGLLYDIHRSRSQWREAAAALLRAATEESSLRAALLTEQAAFSFLAMRRYRKYAFHLILAGHRYNQSGQRKHALRCYCAALDVYEGKNWSHIEDHVHFTLGRVTAHLHHLGTAINFFLRLLTHHQQPAERQTTFLREFVYVFKAYKGTATDKVIPDLALPVFDDQSIRVLLNHQGGHQIEMKAESTEDDDWKGLEEKFDESASTRKMYRFERTNTTPTPNFCVVGESVYVDVTLRNPLQIPVELDNMRLCADLQPADAESEGKDEGTGNDQKKRETDTSDDKSQAPPLYEVDSMDLSLAPSESRQVRLHIKPTAQGNLTITGVQWRLSGVIDGRHEFKLKGKRLNGTKKQRIEVVYAPDYRLSVRVTGPMPLLQVQLHGFPGACVQGELAKMTLEITNHGQTPVKSVRAALSQAGFICLGSEAEIKNGFTDDVIPATSATDAHQPQMAQLTGYKVDDNGLPNVIDIPTDQQGPLVPGHTALVPVWFFARAAGRHVFRLLFSYTGEVPEGGEKGMKYRLFRLQAECVITPAILMSTRAYPSPTALGDYVLKVQTSSSASADTRFDLSQLTCVSPGWQMSALSPQRAGAQVSLAARQAITTFYRLHRIAGQSSSASSAEGSKTEGEDDPARPVTHSHTMFVETCDEDAGSAPLAADTRTTPYLDMLVMDHAVHEHGTELVRQRARSRSVTSKGMAFFGDMAAKQAQMAANKNDKAPVFLQDPNSIALQLLWKIPGAGKESGTADAGAVGKPRFGLHHLPHVRVIAADHDTPLKFGLACPSQVSHDFSNDSLCVVPVTLTIKNCHIEGIDASQITFHVFPPEESDDPVSQRKSLYFWSGVISRELEDIPPGGEATLPLQVCFVQPGVYNVHRYRITATFGLDSHTYTQRFSKVLQVIDSSGQA